MAKFAFLGLGVMGYPMAGHLVKKGGHDVTVYNRSAAKAQQWTKEYGGKSAATPREAAKDCDFVMTFRANTIDHVIETTPNDARYFVGYVGWRPGELRTEIDRGLWSVLDADVDTVFRKDTEGLWEELLQQTKRIRADAPSPVTSQIARR